MDKLTERAIIGSFYKALSNDSGAQWLDGVSNYFTSNQLTETYAWLGQVPTFREWIGERKAKGLPEFNFSITNKHFEDTLDFLVSDLRRDKSGQALVRINELARRANSHWASLLSTLIEAGTSTTCYDGQYFFDTDHTEGNNTTSQSNSVTVDISTLAVETAGTVTLPSVAEFQGVIAKGIEAIVGFKDNENEPMNEDATSFLVMLPINYMNVGLQAVATPVQVAETQTVLSALKDNFSITAVVNPRLTTFGAAYQFPIFRTDSAIKSFIRQEEMGVQMKAKAEGSEYEFDNDAHQYGIDAWRNVGYGYWQNSCLMTMS